MHPRLREHGPLAGATLVAAVVVALLVVAQAVRHADERFVGSTGGVLALWCLFAATYVAARARHRLLWIPAILAVWWLGVELLLAPHLVRTLALRHYYLARDVDHRPAPHRGSNADGLRGAREPAEFAEPGLNLLFLGDSFTEGDGVRPAQAFPYLVESILARRLPDRVVRVANFGWTSSSPFLSLRRLTDIGDAYHASLVVLCVDMTDFQDDIRWRNMLDKRGLYALYDKLPITVELFARQAPDLFRRLVAWSVGNQPVERFFATEAPLEETRRWFEPLMDSVGAIHEWCRVRHADFVLVVLPRAYQYDERESPNSWERDRYTVLGPYCLEPFRYFDELRGRVDYPIVSLLDAFQTTDVFPTCFDDDPHWNPEGHRVAAQAIASALLPVVEARR